MGLEEDLEDLREELLGLLEDYETRLQRARLHLPRWLDLPGEVLRGHFELDGPGPLEGVLIGPRAVAMVAAEVEGFLGEWLGGEEPRAWADREDEKALEKLEGELTALRELTAEAQAVAETFADQGPLGLEQLLETIVFDLETRRETDVEALEVLIRDGEVEAGRDAQAEIAELWEDQRRRVTQLQRVWDEFLAIHDEGIRRTLSGLEELSELVDRTREGIEGSGVLEPSAPMLPGLEEVSSNPFLRASEVSEATEEPPQAAEEVEEESEAVEEEPEVVEEEEEPPPVDLAGPTVPDGSDVATLVGAEVTPEFEEPAEEPEDEAEEELEEEEPAPEEKEEPEEDEPPKEEPAEEEVLRVRSFRVREGWQVVSGGEIAAWLGPPAVVVVVILALSLLSLVDLTPNPIERWDAALPAAFVAMGLLVLFPLISKWRPMWEGVKFRVLRRGEYEDEVDLLVTSSALTFDRTRWRLGELRDVEVRRWEAEGGIFGWVMVLSPPFQKPFELATIERNEEEWAQASVPVDDPPEEAWQLPPEEFSILRGVLERER